MNSKELFQTLRNKLLKTKDGNITLITFFSNDQKNPVLLGMKNKSIFKVIFQKKIGNLLIEGKKTDSAVIFIKKIITSLTEKEMERSFLSASGDKNYFLWTGIFPREKPLQPFSE